MRIELEDGKKYIHLGDKERKGMRGNIRHDFVRYAVGSRLRFELYGKTADYRPSRPNVFITVKKRHETAAIDFAACVIEEIVFTGEGLGEMFFIKGYFTFDAKQAALAAGEYQIDFTAFEPSAGLQQSFPTDYDQPYGVLRVTGR